MSYTEIEKSHATVEEWSESVCEDKDFITNHLTGKQYRFWERRVIATYDFVRGTDASKNDRHHLNNFFLEHGVKVKPGASILTDGPAHVPDTDKLNIEIIQEGTGAQITEGSILVIHYTGKLEDGTVFDSSHQRN